MTLQNQVQVIRCMKCKTEFVREIRRGPRKVLCSLCLELRAQERLARRNEDRRKTIKNSIDVPIKPVRDVSDVEGPSFHGAGRVWSAMFRSAT